MSVGWNREGRTTTERGYGHAWRKVRAKALKRDRGLCVHCYREGILTIATDVDHIVRKADGGTDSLGNLQSLCKAHHAQKTKEEGR